MMSFVERWNEIAGRMDDLKGQAKTPMGHAEQNAIEQDVVKLGGEALAQLVDDIHDIAKVLNTPQIRRRIRKAK